LEGFCPVWIEKRAVSNFGSGAFHQCHNLVLRHAYAETADIGIVLRKELLVWQKGFRGMSDRLFGGALSGLTGTAERNG